MTAITLAPIREVIVWEREGGESRAGLPIDSFDALVSKATGLRSLLTSLRGHLEQVQGLWAGITGQADTQFLVTAIVSSLTSAQSLSDGALQLAGGVYAECRDVGAKVESFMSQDEQAIAAATVEIALQSANMSLAAAQLTVARAQLSGEQGFLNGFITGITFSIVNPVRDNMNAAEQAQALARSALQRSQNAQQRVQVLQAEKQVCRDVLQRLEGVRSGLNDLRNALQVAVTRINGALQMLGPADGSDSDILRKVLVQAAGPAMDDLLAWGPALQEI